MPATSHPVRGKRGHVSVVLHKAELVALGIGHDDNYAPVVIVSFAGGPSSQAGNELNSLADIVGGHVKMDADLPCLRLGNRLEDQPRPGIAAMTQVDPAGRRRPRLTTEQGAPEARDTLRVHAVDGHSRHEVRHVHHFTVAPRCRGGVQDQRNDEPIAARADRGSAEDSQQVLEGLTTARVLTDVPLCRLMTEIRDFQDGQDSGILTDAVPADLIGQPLAYGPATCLA